MPSWQLLVVNFYTKCNSSSGNKNKIFCIFTSLIHNFFFVVTLRKRLSWENNALKKRKKYIRTLLLCLFFVFAVLIYVSTDLVMY